MSNYDVIYLSIFLGLGVFLVYIVLWLNNKKCNSSLCENILTFISFVVILFMVFLILEIHQNFESRPNSIRSSQHRQCLKLKRSNLAAGVAYENRIYQTRYR